MQPQLRLSSLVGKLRHLRGHDDPHRVQPRRRGIAPRSRRASVARRPRRLRSHGGGGDGDSCGASRWIQQAKHLEGTSQRHHRRPTERRLRRRRGRGRWSGWVYSCDAPAGKRDLCERAVHRLERRVALLRRRRRARLRITAASHPRRRLRMRRYGRCGRLMRCHLLLLLLLRFNITQRLRLRVSARDVVRGWRRVDASAHRQLCELRHAHTLHGIIIIHHSLGRRPWPHCRRRRRRRGGQRHGRRRRAIARLPLVRERRRRR